MVLVVDKDNVQTVLDALNTQNQAYYTIGTLKHRTDEAVVYSGQL
jgi:phosphoribosylaminoimidazole (AIR) synthetase